MGSFVILYKSRMSIVAKKGNVFDALELDQGDINDLRICAVLPSYCTQYYTKDAWNNNFLGVQSYIVVFHMGFRLGDISAPKIRSAPLTHLRLRLGCPYGLSKTMLRDPASHIINHRPLIDIRRIHVNQ